MEITSGRGSKTEQVRGQGPGSLRQYPSSDSVFIRYLLTRVLGTFVEPRGKCGLGWDMPSPRMGITAGEKGS